MEDFEIQSDVNGRKRSNHRSNTKCNYVVFCLLLLSALAGFVLYKYSQEDEQEEIPQIEVLGDSFIESFAKVETRCEEDLCLSKSCVTTAARILKAMDETKPPCQDFHEYACGNYGKNILLRPMEHLYNPYVEAIDNFAVYIKKMFERADEVTQTNSFQKARILYETCMDDDKRESQSKKLLLHFLRNTTVSWPLFEDSLLPDEISWVNVVKEMESYGIETLFKPKFIPFHNNGTTMIDLGCSMTVLQPALYLNPTDENNEPRLEYHEEVFVFMLYTLDFKRRDARNLFKKILLLETTLSQALTGSEEGSVDCETPCPRAYCLPCKTPSPEGKTLSELHVQQLKDIWSDLLNKPASDLQVRSSCNGNLQAALTVLNNSPKKTVLNYILWRAVLHLAQYLGTKQQHLYNNYLGNLVDGHPVGLSMWKECSEFVRMHMGPAVVKGLTERRYLNEDHLKEVENRFNNVKNGFKFLFYAIPWVTNETVQEFSNKVDAVSLRVGLPDELKEDNNVDQLYEDLHVDRSESFFNNVLNMMKFKTQKRFERLMLLPEANSANYEYLLDHTPLDTKASYNYEKNEVAVDYGLVITPLMKYGPGLPEYLEPGQTIVLAREISHALDSTGIHYDKNGQRTVMDKLPLTVKQKFHDFVSCLLIKYPTSSPNLVDADIADLGSMFITSAALELQLLFAPEDEVLKELPGVPLTRRQIYFLQSAQMFCELADESHPSVQNRRRTAKERLNMVVANLPNFGEVFECDPESPMNPSQKCNLLN